MDKILKLETDRTQCQRSQKKTIVQLEVHISTFVKVTREGRCGKATWYSEKASSAAEVSDGRMKHEVPTHASDDASGTKHRVVKTLESVWGFYRRQGSTVWGHVFWILFMQVNPHPVEVWIPGELDTDYPPLFRQFFAQLAKVRDRIKRLFSPSPRDEQHSDPKSATHPTPPFFTIGRLHLSTSDAHYKEAISAVAYGFIINRPTFGGLN